jgi:hypothetical protein
VVLAIYAPFILFHVYQSCTLVFVVGNFGLLLAFNAQAGTDLVCPVDWIPERFYYPIAIASSQEHLCLRYSPSLEPFFTGSCPSLVLTIYFQRWFFLGTLF